MNQQSDLFGQRIRQEKPKPKPAKAITKQPAISESFDLSTTRPYRIFRSTTNPLETWIINTDPNPATSSPTNQETAR